MVQGQTSPSTHPLAHLVVHHHVNRDLLGALLLGQRHQRITLSLSQSEARGRPCRHLLQVRPVVRRGPAAGFKAGGQLGRAAKQSSSGAVQLICWPCLHERGPPLAAHSSASRTPARSFQGRRCRGAAGVGGLLAAGAAAAAGSNGGDALGGQGTSNAARCNPPHLRASARLDWQATAALLKPRRVAAALGWPAVAAADAMRGSRAACPASEPAASSRGSILTAARRMAGSLCKPKADALLTRWDDTERLGGCKGGVGILW